MDILKKNKDILDLFSISILEDNVELELLFGDSERNNPLDKSIFLRLLNNLKQEYNFLGESTGILRPACPYPSCSSIESSNS